MPVWVAFGSLIWLKFPINIFMSLAKRFTVLVGGIIISSIIYDSAYIAVGFIVGASVKLSPVELLPYFVIILALSFAAILIGKKLLEIIRPRLSP